MSAGSLSAASPGHVLLPVKLPVFEGPLDLLLHLIERNQLDVSGVSLVLVVDQYMGYLEDMRAELKLDAASEFLAVAGRLLLIKSRSLLPHPEAALEPEDDPAEELARQLEEYRRFKRIADELRALKETRGPTFSRAAEPPDVPPVVKLTGLDVERLIRGFRRALERLRDDPPESLEAPPPRVTQADRMAFVTDCLRRDRTLLFDRLLHDCREVEDVVVTFLAVLELLKQGRLRIWQAGSFGAIILSRPAMVGRPSPGPQTLIAVGGHHATAFAAVEAEASATSR